MKRTASSPARVDDCMKVLGRLAALAGPDDAVWRDLELTMAQLKALFVLTHHQPQPIGGLARRLGIAEPSASLLVDKLEAQGLALRESDPGDRRRTLVVPTAAALDLHERLHRTRRDRLASWLERLDEAELDALLRGVTALVREAEPSPDGSETAEADA